MAMSQDQRYHAGGFLPPPPSTPDDGPSALELPPLEPPPQELVRASRASRGLQPGAWLLLVAVFLAGTALTYYLER